MWQQCECQQADHCSRLVALGLEMLGHSAGCNVVLRGHLHSYKSLKTSNGRLGAGSSISDSSWSSVSVCPSVALRTSLNTSTDKKSRKSSLSQSSTDAQNDTTGNVIVIQLFPPNFGGNNKFTTLQNLSKLF